MNRGLDNGNIIISSAVDNIVVKYLYKLASMDISGCEIYKNNCCGIIMGIGIILILVVIFMMSTLIFVNFEIM